jgi:hypothetical protein
MHQHDTYISTGTDTFRPLQHGQPERLPTRSAGVASHSWSGPASHCHQYFLFVREATSDGVTSPFLVGCHCAATSSEASESNTEGARLHARTSRLKLLSDHSTEPCLDQTSTSSSQRSLHQGHCRFCIRPIGLP